MAEFPKLALSGIKVIIVGAGFAGLTAAIECDRKGHSVILLEKVDELKPLGDVISFGQNSTRIFKKWPGVFEELQPIIHKSDHINYISWEGRYVTTQHWDSEWARWGQSINGHRSEIHRIVFEHAKARGIDIRMGQSVTDYFEDGNGAGVEVNGERLNADIVISAEGVRSRGRKIVLGFDEKPQPSGYAVFRTWFAADEVAKNEKTKHLVENGDSHNCWIGQDVHFIAAGVKDGKEISWVCTHKDDGDIEESWQFPGHIEDVLKVLQGWDPVVLELVKMTPKDRLFDYKLVYRDPLPTFISPKARIALIGDTAHPFLPTSIQGASQAMEDGVTLAACLDIGGKERVTEALRVYEKIRYERVHKIQATGVSTRESWHKADWDVIWKNPQSLHLARQDWILDFDCEANAYDSYETSKQSLNTLDN
ncbi:putative salicylate hydroxylase protein [Phaeoacremonium minimum UCRPA7]|uniref:Putative salicylate hydroxylase protein n=1 Tax=Phaeoacremonium minimum (strain UCR-PA7) TaxID=1286976 RepID=R8BGW5_PHAM7|nr:putative salicylate hydroxylase protein [Phaeoacremonium minimum UCRPA7]EON98472.1 putative salicylate hydroxylase protein [Phaeoacremonium minimum UCRPA7]